MPNKQYQLEISDERGGWGFNRKIYRPGIYEVDENVANAARGVRHVYVRSLNTDGEVDELLPVRVENESSDSLSKSDAFVASTEPVEPVTKVIEVEPVEPIPTDEEIAAAAEAAAIESKTLNAEDLKTQPESNFCEVDGCTASFSKPTSLKRHTAKAHRQSS